MIKKDLTHYQARRLAQNSNRCMICGEMIADNEKIILIKEKMGKYKKYSFLHVRCLNGEEQEKEVNETTEN